LAKLEQVFGVSNELVLSYVARQGVDDRLQSALQGKKHTIIYGASKQGKTSLIFKHLKEKEYARILCSPTSTREKLYNTLLGSAGARIVESETKGFSFGLQIDASGKVGGIASLLSGVEAEAALEGKGERASEKVIRTIPMDLSSVQDVFRALQQTGWASRKIVLDNFHYLPEETQSELAYDLRLWNDLDVAFIIIGIWKRDNYMQAQNPELTDRVVEIPVEPWTEKHFTEVIREGEPHLNITINDKIVHRLASEANGSIGVFQELTKNYCRENDVYETRAAPHNLQTTEAIAKALVIKAGEYDSTYKQQLLRFSLSDKPGKENPLYLKYYLTKFVIDTPILRLDQGVRKVELVDYIEKNLHRTVNRNVLNSQLGALLQKLQKAQADIKIPPLFQYSGTLFRVIDPVFSFYMKHADKAALRDDLVFPADADSV